MLVIPGELLGDSFGLKKKWQERICEFVVYLLYVIVTVGSLQCILLFDGSISAKIIYSLAIIYAFGSMGVSFSSIILMFTPSISTIMALIQTPG